MVCFRFFQMENVITKIITVCRESKSCQEPGGVIIGPIRIDRYTGREV